MQYFTLQILRVLTNLLNKSFILFLGEDCQTGSAYFTYIYLWLISWRRIWIIIHYWLLSGKYHLQYMILAIWSVVCYHPVLSSLSCSCLWQVLSLTVLLYNVGNSCILLMSQTTKIILKPKDCIFLVNYPCIQFTPQLFSTLLLQTR